MVVEWVLAVLVGLLAIATTAALFLGVAGLLGVARLVRCEQCGRLDMTSGPVRSGLCVYCRHTHLFHPVHSLHHLHPTQPAAGQRAA